MKMTTETYMKPWSCNIQRYWHNITKKESINSQNL